MTERRFTNQQIDRLLRPKSVAVVGASDRVGALGATLLNNLATHDKTFGIESMCVGGGQGMAMVVERLS